MNSSGKIEVGFVISVIVFHINSKNTYKQKYIHKQGLRAVLDIDEIQQVFPFQRTSSKRGQIIIILYSLCFLVHLAQDVTMKS